MSAPSAVGASVGELLDQAENLLYTLATETPSGNRLLAAMPAYTAACARLTAAAVGPRYTGLVAAGRNADTDPVLHAGLRLDAHIGVTSFITSRRAFPDPRMVRAAQLIGAAADLIECAHDRPGVAQRDAAQADSSRSAVIIRAAELTLTEADLTIRACGRAHQLNPTTSPNTPARLTSRATPLFETRRLAADVLDAASGRPDRSALDDVRVPVGRVARPGDLLDGLHVALGAWRTASLDSARSSAVSSAELQRASVEARHVIALTAALTDTAQATGAMPRADAVVTMTRLQRAGTAWSAVTTAWTQITTGVPPSEHHISASLELQAAVRAIGRAENGAWLLPEELRKRVSLPATLAAVRGGLGDVLDVARAHGDATNRLVQRGRVSAKASTLSLSDERVEARLRGRHVPVTRGEVASLRGGYRDVLAGADATYRQMFAVTHPAGSLKREVQPGLTLQERTDAARH